MLDEIKKLTKHTSIYSLGNILSKTVGFFLIPFYTHYLTPADYGTLELLDLSTALVGLLLNMWMNASVVRYYYEYDDEKNRNEVVSTALISTASVAALVSACGMIWARGFSQLILKTPNYYQFIWLISATLFFTCLNSVAWSYLRARQRSTLLVVLQSISLVISLSLNIYFIAVMKTGLVGILYSGLISTGLVTIGMTVMTVREVRWGFDRQKLVALVRFGSPLIFTSASAFVLNFADRFFLQRYTNISTVGIYALGYKFGFMLSFLIIQPFIMIWGARMYQIAKQENSGETFSRLFAYFLLVLTAAALALSLVIRNVIAIIAPPQYFDAYRIVPVVALAYVFYGIAYYFQTGIYISKKTIYLGILGTASAAVNIGLDFLLIPRYAALGAAWATVLSFIFMAILGYVFSQTVYPIPYKIHKIAIAVASAVAVYYVSTLVHTDWAIVTAILKLSLVLVFTAAIFLLGFFDRRELTKLREVWDGARGRYKMSMASGAAK